MLVRFIPAALFAALMALCALALVAKKNPNVTAPLALGVVGQDAPYTHGLPEDALKKGPVLVNFFASWCLPCAAEQEALAACARESGVKVYGVNYKDTPVPASRFLEKYGNPYAAIAHDPEGRVAVDWGVTGVPETFVIDKAGKVRRRIAEPLTEESCAKRVKPLLEEEKK